MASYPTSVFAPAARSNGQTIDASHVNGLQDEVTAIESALEGTITHNVNISGASSVASLSVTGGSTFASRPVMPPPDIVKVFMASTQTLGSSNASTVTWDAQAFITNSSMHSLVSNQMNLVPQSTGVYRITAQLGLTENSTTVGYRGIILLDSSGTAIASNRVSPGSVAAGLFLQVTGYKRFDAVGGNVRVLYDASGASTISLSTGIGVTWATLEKL